MGIEHILSHISRALKYPVLVLAVLALVLALVEVVLLVFELSGRRRRSLRHLEEVLPAIQDARAAGNFERADALVSRLGITLDMANVLDEIIAQLGRPLADERISKRLANFEYQHLRRLERTRILVRFGPALGLMGTLIPLSPALSGLAHGNVTTLSNNLQVAFSVTVTGLLVGAIAFAVSLVRDRMYGEDYSDVQYIAAMLTAPAPPTRLSHLPLVPEDIYGQPPPPVRRLSTRTPAVEAE